MAHKTVRIDEATFKKVQDAANLHNRSLSGQLAHWVNIGRVMEKSPKLNLARIEAALKAEIALDSLTAEEAAIYEDRFYKMMGEETPEEAAFYKNLGERGRALGYEEE